MQAQARTLPYPAPPGWSELPYRGCGICDHGVDVAGVRHCACPEIVSRGHTKPVALVRARHGACGGEARHLTYPGLVLL